MLLNSWISRVWTIYVCYVYQFLNAGQGISTNIFIKTIAYICAVFVLIKAVEQS